MANVQSLGVHEPSAFPYVFDESLLPSRHSETSYTWRIFPVHDETGNEVAEEEILQTNHCVLWSRGGIVKRAFNLDVEGEEILHSFVTRFPACEAVSYRQNRQSSSNATVKSESSWAGERSWKSPPANEKDSGQAVVVILKTKAHIYLLKGDTYIVSLPFEVERAFPSLCGCLLQRKGSPLVVNPSPLSAPQNSFVSSQLSSSQMRGPQITLKTASNSRPSLTLSPAVGPFPLPPIAHNDSIPSVFSLTDPQAELGIAVRRLPTPEPARLREKTVEKPFDPAEELLYVSRGNELAASEALNLEPLCIAVTWNAKSGTTSVWQIQYTDRESCGSPKKRRKVSHNEQNTRRRSSNMFRVHGSTTPVGRGLGDSRESLGAQLGHSFPETHLSNRRDDHKSSEVDNLATELGPDLAEVGAQTRAARRVSSMLARTDLSMGPDRLPVSGLASGAAGRKSLNRAGHRSDSMGDFRDRQSFGAMPRSSLPGVGSFISDETSFMDAPIDRLLEGLGPGVEFEDKTVIDEAMNELPAEAFFSKVHSIPASSPPSMPESSAARFRVFTLMTSLSGGSGSAALARISVCITDSQKGEMCVIKAEVTLASSRASKLGKSQPPLGSKTGRLILTAVTQQRGGKIIDACKIRDGDHSCMLVLKQNENGQRELLLEAAGILATRLELPSPLLIHDPLAICARNLNQTDLRREFGRGRILNAALGSITALKNTSIRGQVDLVDANSRHHRLRLQLEPSHPRVRKVLEAVEFALQDQGGSGLFMLWIEVARWLRLKVDVERLEWSAMVMTIFCIIIPFISDRQGRNRSGARPKKTSEFRSSSGAAVDMSCWNEMVDEECIVGGTSPAWSMSPGWQWINRETDFSKRLSPQTSSRLSSTATVQAPFHGRRNKFLTQCVSWTREFMQTSAGGRMVELQGFWPTAPNQDRDSRSATIASVLVALHLLREEQKLDTRSSCSDQNDVQLAPVLAQVGQWLNWPSWGAKEGSYYYTEISDIEQQVFDDNLVTSLELVPQPFVPPSIFEFVEASFSRSETRPFLTLLDVVGNREAARAAFLLSRAKRLTPRTLALLKFFSRFASLDSRAARVEWMFNSGLEADILASLPVGISATFFDAILSCEGSPPPSWSEPLLQLIGRDDLKTRTIPLSSHPPSKSHNLGNHEAARDYHSIGTLILDTEPSHSWDVSSEADRQGVTRLIFRDDRRFQDASRLVNQLRVPVAECIPEPDWSEADLLDAQRELVQLVIMRTMTVASGRGMMNYSSRIPLLTEKVPVPAFTLQCQVKPSNVTFNADRAAFTEDRAVWAFFHNGTAAGLTISKDARGIDTSWILFNKPPELTNRHAGFLLALGLNGHLKSLAKWVAFKYLTPKHTMTSIGLLLGLSASYLGTMDTLITRLLSVHVTRMLPPGAAELNLSPLTQTTGIMGIGLLYCSSQHRRMSEVMLSEIENNDTEEGVPAEQTLRDEGYRLAAGFALGFINLGQGHHLHSLHDMNVMERLLSIAIGTKNVNLVHILDRATSGATIAFALIYMKTNSATLAHKIDIPDTPHQFDYVRPDIFLLRTVARHLILWSSISPTTTFIHTSLPPFLRHRAPLTTTHHLHSADLPLYHILAGLCLALGLRYAGSFSPPARDLLLSYLDQFLRLTSLPAPNYDAKLTRNAVRNCQDVTALAAAAVMAGSGDLSVFRRLRALHGRQDAETPYGSHLAAHMAIGVLFLGGGTYTLGTSNVAVAALLCAFYPLFPSGVMDNQAHLQAFRHLWVLAVEPRCVVGRDVETGRAVGVDVVVVMKGGVEGGQGPGMTEKRLTAPCLIPDLDSIQEIRTDAKAYWPVTIRFEGAEGERRKADFRRSGAHFNLFLRRRAPYDAVHAAPGVGVGVGVGGQSSVFLAEMQALAESGPAPSVGLSHVSAAAAAAVGGVASARLNPLEWLWGLEGLRGLDGAERALVLPRALPYAQAYGQVGGYGARALRAGVVDARLELEGLLGGWGGERGRERDQWWQLRLLFGWVEAEERERERGNEGLKERRVEGVKRYWLGRDVVEGLRWRVWMMGAGLEEDGDGDGDGES